ncbi:hypothetical protein KY284_004001 [Solanum tuberosum]|nr:hypothetical protein KY284_004001 [Solanum tuberosum]
MDAIIPALTHRIHQNSEVKRAWARVVLGWVTPGKSSCCIPPFCRNSVVNDVVRTGDGGVTGGVMRRCAWRLGRWGAG